MADSEIRKRLAELGNKTMSVTLHAELYRAALDNLAAAIKIQEELDGMGAPDARSVHEEFPKEDRQYRAILISIVFSAITAEALINHYGMSQPDEPIFKRLDKLPLTSKWLVFPKLARGVSLEPGEEPFQGLDKLRKLRNYLVHFRPVKKTHNEFYREVIRGEYRAVTLDDAKRAALTVHRLADWLHTQDPGFDLGEMVAPSKWYEPIDFLQAHERVLGKRPR